MLGQGLASSAAHSGEKPRRTVCRPTAAYLNMEPLGCGANTSDRSAVSSQFSNKF
jgi:hypothetical protein